MRYIILCCLSGWFFACSPVTTIYLVRHAEKSTTSSTMMAGDMDLSAAGNARAAVLSDSLSGKRIAAMFATPLQRTQQTLQPLANVKGLVIKQYPATQVASNALLDSLSLIKGKIFVIAGHSNTVPEMIRHLGLPLSFAGNIPENDFDNLFVITIKNNEKKLVQKTYGVISP